MIKLLIVDDDPPVVEGLAHAIGAGDLPISTLNIAYSAKEALELFKVCVFDLVISDIRMPEMSGLELMEQIKQTWSGTKVIFFSGYADFRYAQEAVKLGASDFWLKPFEDELMIARLRELIAELEREWEKSVSDRDVFRQCIDELFNELEQNEMFVEHNFMYREICSMMMSQLLSKNQLEYDDLMTMERLSTYPSSHAAELKADLNKLFAKWIDAKPTFADDRKHMMIQQAKAFIEHHLHEEISLDTVAKRLYLNPSYLSKMFHQYTGEKLVSYMTRKKMERAVLLLSDPAMKVQDIAGQLGYRSPNYFSKVFRSVYQLSPQEFRFAMASADRRPGP